MLGRRHATTREVPQSHGKRAQPNGLVGKVTGFLPFLLLLRIAALVRRPSRSAVLTGRRRESHRSWAWAQAPADPAGEKPPAPVAGGEPCCCSRHGAGHVLTQSGGRTQAPGRRPPVPPGPLREPVQCVTEVSCYRLIPPQRDPCSAAPRQDRRLGSALRLPRT